MSIQSIILAFTLLFTPVKKGKNIYDFSFQTIEGKKINFSQYKGKKILIVNTASKCGYTPQYEDLEKLNKMYGNKLVIIGFPANNFGQQEPGTNSEINEFCQKNYGVSFLMAEKISVKGEEINSLFKWLTSQDNPDFEGEIKWNFEKFLINEKGKLIHRYRSNVQPLDEKIVKAL